MAKKALYFVHLLVFPVTFSVPLDSYNVDSGQVSVSGISSGAAMATQFHVAHSRDVMGVGTVAGEPYMCAGGNSLAVATCMLTPGLVSVTALKAVTTSAALVSNIDPTRYIRDDNVWIFAGALDTVVRPGAGLKLRDYYNHYVTSGSVKTVFNVPAQHCMPTTNYGGQCNKLNIATYINDCDYDAAYEMLNHIYGGHLKAPSPAQGTLIKFDQSEFFYFAPPATYSMDNFGYVYVPTGCQNKQTACKLHIAFHGCNMQRSRIGDMYVRHAGYNEVGEANDIIILYPQVTTTLTNPMGCWDWWGYTGPLYATKHGFQMTAVYRMMERVIM